MGVDGRPQAGADLIGSVSVEVGLPGLCANYEAVQYAIRCGRLQKARDAGPDARAV